MALDRSNRYPGRFENPTTASPQGAFKNRTSPTSQDGSYFEADWANDWDGFFARILNVAGVTPNGVIDTGSASQLYDALMTATPGRLLGVRVISTNSVYTKTPNTRSAIVEMVGGGGAGGSPAQNASGFTSGSGGGNGGSYAKFRIDLSNVSTVNCSIGAGGTATGQTPGGNGGSTSFGSYCSVNGGSGGLLLASASTVNRIYGAPPNTGIYGTSTGVSLISTNTGGLGGDAIILTSGARAGAGGQSTLGSQIFGPGLDVAGNAALSPGGGGSGCVASNASFGTNLLGGNGAPGLIIIYEYS